MKTSSASPTSRRAPAASSACAGNPRSRTQTLPTGWAGAPRLIKGYGETPRRGKGNFLAIADALIETPPTANPREQAQAIRKAREAALADPEGKALGTTLGKPVVWMKPVAKT